MAGSRTLKLKILGDVDSLNKAFKDADRDVQTFGSRLKSFSIAAGKAFLVAGAAVAGFAAKLGIDAIKAASDLNETINKTQVVFGKSSKAILDWSKNSSRAIGQSQKQALEAASTFAVFGKAAGLSGDNLVDFSTSLSVLASDLASFNNSTPEEAILAIGAALRGESEPIRRFGVLLDDATLKQEALRLGLIKTTGEALTPQEKALAAYEAIMRQTNDAQGDFARTSDGLANAQRILAADIENVKARMGQDLLPVAQNVVNWMINTGLPALEAFGRGFAGEDEQSITSQNRKFNDAMGFTKDDVLPPLSQAMYDLGKDIGSLADSFKGLYQTLDGAGEGGKGGNILRFFGNVIKIIDKTIGLIDTLIQKINTFDENFSKPFGQETKSPAELIGGWFSGRAVGGPVNAGQTYLVGERGPELFTTNTSGTIIPNHKLGAGGGNITINVSGALDPEAVARQINQIMQRSAGRSGNYSNFGIAPLAVG